MPVEGPRKWCGGAQARSRTRKFLPELAVVPTAHAVATAAPAASTAAAAVTIPLSMGGAGLLRTGFPARMRALTMRPPRLRHLLRWMLLVGAPRWLGGGKATTHVCGHAIAAPAMAAEAAATMATRTVATAAAAALAATATAATEATARVLPAVSTVPAPRRWGRRGRRGGGCRALGGRLGRPAQGTLRGLGSPEHCIQFLVDRVTEGRGSVLRSLPQ